MAAFAPFRALRYNPDRVELGAVIAPPYDVVESEERARLAARHRANAIHVELPEADRSRGLDPYRHAAVLLEEWVDDGIVVLDEAPRFTAYRMTTPEGRSSLGVLGLLDFDRSWIRPHEQTLPKAKTDRMDLLSATRANLSPIWGLSLAAGLTGLLAPGDADVAGATDDDGVLHEAWPIVDPRAESAISHLVEAAPVVVADGHHRLEVGSRFAEQDGTPGAQRILAFVVELVDEQVSIGPVHRIVSGLPAGTDAAAAMAGSFQLTHVGDLDDATVASVADGRSLALATADGVWMMTGPPDDGVGRERLDSEVVADALGALPAHDLTFRYSTDAAIATLRDGSADAVVITRPVRIDQIRTWAEEGRLMPPKSTYFFPKPRTGVVFRRLDD